MTAVIHRRPGRDVALVWHQVRYEQLSFWRNPQSAFFTFVFPVVLISIFGALFHGAGISAVICTVHADVQDDLAAPHA